MIGTSVEAWEANPDDPDAIAQALIDYATRAGVEEALNASEPDTDAAETEAAGDIDTTEIRFDDRGPAVEALQNRLADLGFDPGPRDADGNYNGVFDDDTALALHDFQNSQMQAIERLMAQVPGSPIASCLTFKAAGSSALTGLASILALSSCSFTAVSSIARDIIIIQSSG